MDYEWDIEEETERYTAFWQTRKPSPFKNSPTIWNERAKDWERELRSKDARQAYNQKRVRSTVEFLRSHGLLQSEDKVIDIGCGLGRFVTAFAQTANHVTGLDFSQSMIKFGTQYAAEQGIKNVCFETCDFKELDIDKKNWRGQFDLVFASITPALDSQADLKKMIAMSRAYCFSSNFVHASDPLVEDVWQELYKSQLPLQWDGRQFYAMFNILWLQGYFPQVTLFKELKEEHISSQTLATQLAEKYLPGADRIDVENIRNCLSAHEDSNGLLLLSTSRWYAWMLWDVRDQYERKY